MERRLSFVVFAVAFVVGAWLRLDGVTQQLIVSDEWHGLHAAALLGYRELFSLMTPGATSIPMNLYYRALLEGVGWSELALRMPSLLAGVATLLALPLVSRRWLGTRGSALFCGLLAISPVLIFYSRYSRPYAMVVLLTFLALVACHAWWRTGRSSAAVGFVAAGVLAAWLHGVEVRMLALPLIYYGAVGLIAHRRGAGSDSSGPGLLAWASVVLVSAGLLVVLFLPAMLGTGAGLAGILGQATLTGSSFVSAMELLIGTSQFFVSGLLVLLALLGWVALLGIDRVFAGLLLTIAIGTLASVVVTHPHDSQLPVVLARYLIPLAAPFMLLVTLGVEYLLGVLEARTTARRGSAVYPAIALAVAIALPLSLFFLGPLPERLSRTISFSNSKSFQVSYAPLAAGESYLARLRRAMDKQPGSRPSMSPFYESLASDRSTHAVIEYPVPIGDVFLALPDYQRTHGKRVVGGFRRRPPPEGALLHTGLVPAGWLPGMVLKSVSDPKALRFTSHVDVEDPQAVRASGARYLIVHRDLAHEIRGEPAKKRSRVSPRFSRNYGPAVYEDDLLIVFDLAHSR